MYKEVSRVEWSRVAQHGVWWLANCCDPRISYSYKAASLLPSGEVAASQQTMRCAQFNLLFYTSPVRHVLKFVRFIKITVFRVATREVWKVFTDVSEEYTSSIIKISVLLSVFGHIVRVSMDRIVDYRGMTVWLPAGKTDVFVLWGPFNLLSNGYHRACRCVTTLLHLCWNLRSRGSIL
jgi:hypothetical protein